VDAPSGLQVPVGSPPPAGTFVQVPWRFVTAQLWQDGQVPMLQQYPSVQLPLVHWLLPVHATPLPVLATQLPPAPVQ
jgi:hypothetical protein